MPDASWSLSAYRAGGEKMMERNTVSSSSKLSIALVFAGVVIAITGVLLLSCSLVKEIKINEQASAQESLDVSGSSDPTVLQEERWERSISGGSDAASTGIADKHVLFISSYDPTSAYYRDQISGMLSVSNSYDIQIDVVNMDTSKHRSDEDLAHFTDFMAEEMTKTLSADIESFLKSMEGSREKTKNSGKKKPKSREKILALLREHPEYSARKLAEAIGITPKAVEKQLANLKATGVIKREGPDKGGRWVIL